MAQTIYTTQANVENYLDRPLSDEETELFTILENAVADIIDNYCARSFSLARSFSSTINSAVGDLSDNSFQRFDGGEAEIFFDQPLQTDTGQQGVFTPYVGYIDYDTGTWTLIEPKDYIFYGLNRQAKTSVCRYLGVFPYGQNNIFVYGAFTDFVTPPQGVVLAASIICADIINLPDGITSETIEGYSRSFSQDWNPTVQKVLDIYRRVVI